MFDDFIIKARYNIQRDPILLVLQGDANWLNIDMSCFNQTMDGSYCILKTNDLFCTSFSAELSHFCCILDSILIQHV